LRNDIRDICDVVQQHSRAEECLHALFARSVVSVVASTVCLQPVDRKLFVACVQPFGSGWEVGETEDDSGHGGYSYDAFNDEKPAETLKPSSAVHMANAVCDRTTECSGKITESSNQPNTDCSLIVSVPASLFSANICQYFTSTPLTK